MYHFLLANDNKDGGKKLSGLEIRTFLLQFTPVRVTSAILDDLHLPPQNYQCFLASVCENSDSRECLWKKLWHSRFYQWPSINRKKGVRTSRILEIPKIKDENPKKIYKNLKISRVVKKSNKIRKKIVSRSLMQKNKEIDRSVMFIRHYLSSNFFSSQHRHIHTNAQRKININISTIVYCRDSRSDVSNVTFFAVCVSLNITRELIPRGPGGVKIRWISRVIVYIPRAYYTPVCNDRVINNVCFNVNLCCGSNLISTEATRINADGVVCGKVVGIKKDEKVEKAGDGGGGG